MSTALQPVPENGLVLGRYRPLRPLGSGGSGSVWLAHDEKSGIEVALKIVGKEGQAASRAEREAHSAARLRHPHCLRAFGFASDTRHVYIPYEYVPGHTLRHALRSQELDDEGVVEAAAQVLDALAHAHASGIVHRDVKPSNVLLAEGDEVSVRLFDFGLAQLADAETLTAAGDVPGTLAYIPPERLQGRAAGPPADVWAVGVLLWEALAGRHPFWQSSPMELGKQIQAGAASLASVRPDLPRPLAAAVDRALAVDPARRPTASALSRTLRGARRERAERPLRPIRLRFSPRLAERIGASAGAGLAAAWVSATLPFFPSRWPLLLAVLAAALTAARPRLGLAFVLAVPVFPLGNVALGLALLYAAAAAAWLVLAWPRPRSGLLFGLALLAPVGALGLLPLVLFRVRGWFRRFVYGVAGVLVTGFSGAGQLQAVATEESPVRVARWLWGSTAADSDLALLGLVVGAAAAVLPGCARRGELAIGAGAAGLLAGALVAAPSASAVPFVVTAWLTAAALLFRWRRSGGQPADLHALGTLLRTTHAFFLSRVKPAGGPRWPQALSPQRLGHAARR
jgi:eukaryotic-like serine/threonine-protein kinase